MLKIIKNGNVELFKTYLSLNGTSRSLSSALVHFVPAIDTGNVDFVRLLLKHNFCRTEGSDGGAFTRPGSISVDMLKMLHEEFDMLYVDVLYPNIMYMILFHCVRSNTPDSVQYFVEHLPTVNRFSLKLALRKAVKLVGKHGNVEIFKSLCNTYIGAGPLIGKDHVHKLLKDSLDHGHTDLIKHIYSLTMGDDKTKDMIIGYFDGLTKAGKTIPDSAKLRVTPSATIHKEDFDMIESLLPQVVTIDDDTWRRMSPRMATFITHPRHKQLPLFSQSNLEYLLDSIAHPECQIIEEIVLRFIDNFPNSTSNAIVLFGRQQQLTTAMDFSSLVAQKLHKTFNLPFDQHCLVKALDSRNHNMLSFIFDRTPADHLVQWSSDTDVKDALKQLILTSSLDIVVLVLDKLPSAITSKQVLGHALANSSLGVAQHVINMYTMSDIENNAHQMSLMACMHDNQSGLDILVQYFKDAGKTLPLFTLHHLETASNYNCYHILENHFGSPEFNSLPKIQRLRILNIIMYRSLSRGHTRIIRHCQSLINLIQSNKKRDRDDTVCDDVPMAVHASLHLESLVHKVFNNNKLCKTIMDNISGIHKSLGSTHCMKGAELLSKHSLEEYIKHGASQWFKESYNMSYNNMPLPNVHLLELAMLHPNKSILDTLLTNPMLAPHHEAEDFLNHLITNQSSCDHHDWERALDQYFVITSQIPSNVEIKGPALSFIKHPAFLRKLISMGFKVEQLKDSMRHMVSSWLTEPWALEMFKLMREHSLFSLELLSNILVQSVRLNIIVIVRYCLAELGLVHIFGTDDIVNIQHRLLSCWSHHGRPDQVEMRDLILTHTFPSPDSITIQLQQELLLQAISGGNLTMCNKMISINDATPRGYYFHLSEALQHNTNVDLVNFILNIEPQPEDTKQFKVNCINSEILSIELINRLEEHPSILCSFEMVLSEAIKAGKKDVILNDVDGKYSTDFMLAFKTALTCGDIDTAKAILKRVPKPINSTTMSRSDQRLCFNKLVQMIISSKEPSTSNKITGPDIIELIVGLNDVYALVMSVFNRIIFAASFVSFDLLKHVLDHCVARADTQSIGYLMDLSTRSGASTPKPRDQLIPLRIGNRETLAFILDKGYLLLEDQSSYKLENIVEAACGDGLVEVVRLVHQRCTTPELLKRYLPTLNSLKEASSKNHHQMIGYMFEDIVCDGGQVHKSPVHRASIRPSHIARLLDVIGQAAFENGNIKIIELVQRVSKTLVV
ncbi:hypothetical protein SAMD00019534_054290 [Acytostelium subglobosum LB1]|uniref:hypothetical protein n=1 Tax=Acytostelium subglobosum LB1 TaxID=1410327 RepID=UPI00064516A4|nr:hypothetical protein SAMD00019534_054290 [Acytostelium subglobosum LB1]GAM22254.1 hypothetical protein SAMD00019534_054290 [Acytostelium subglobosum LB1]|eukprot:XP_012754374.1 hypothetical protein SAMD00019534_054290 [Acytostelium subglobosum LB1]